MSKNPAKAAQSKDDNQHIVNSLSALVSSLAGNGFIGLGTPYGSAPLSQTAPMFYNLRWYMVSNNRQLLSQLFVEHGIVQTLVEQPVDDAFRAGVDIKTDQLSEDELTQLKVYCERDRLTAAIIQALKWNRLYGGAGILIITPQDPATPLDINAIKEDTPVEYHAVDMWELYFTAANIYGTQAPAQIKPEDEQPLEYDSDFYNYYGTKVHKSRVYRIEGKQAPSFIRPRLRGWGMSELERLVRSINQYFKNQDVVYDLLDEAKVDVYKMKGYNTALLNAAGTAQISQRIQGANMIKNYNHALTMDKEDEYEQKQITFSGLGEILLQIRQGLAADLKMPVTKLFGVSSAGFNSGEDDIENYNAMIEGEIRSKIKFIIVDLLGLACQKLFGHIPDDLTIEFPPLRILSAEQEEKVKDMQFSRTMAAWQSGLIPDEEAKAAINRESLLPIVIDEKIGAVDSPVEGDYTTQDSENQA